MGWTDILLIAVVVIAIIVFALYSLNKWAAKKMSAQNEMMEQYRMTQTAYIIDKKRDKITNVSMPKAVIEQIPKRAKYIKMNFVKAKIGPQIVTLIAADKNLYNALPVKKSVKIDISGLYVVGMAGLKTASEMRTIEKEKKEKAKLAKKSKKK
ncbi:MAG: hypothetical protein ACI4VF_03045 [Lachnospirales bacterium]